ncbi:MAG: discoidin domain-containing protein [Saprospiraceae bacterium]|nr:discoidin domain-containing protein [Saprospiraceae bacterium]
MKQFIILLFTSLFFVPAQSQNLALNGTASASDNAIQPAMNAIDGDVGTRWESEFSDPQWITIDLGTSYEIGKVILNWEGAFASAYEIQITDDSTFTTFTSAYTTTTGDGGIDDITVNETGRYVRMYGTVRGTVYGYSIWEFEIYEAVDPATDASLSDLTVNGTTIAEFSSSVLNYNVELPMGTEIVPTVSATPSQASASAVVTDATSPEGTTTVLVTAQNGIDTKTYTINFSVELTPVNQTFDLTFEPGTVGSNAAAWNVFENDSNPPFEVVPNPDASGVNTSPTVGKLITLAAGAPFAGCETQHGTIWEWVLDGTTTTITIDVYKPVISDVGIKMVNKTSGTVFELLQPNTVINEWETLTYDITSAVASGDNVDVDQIVVFTDWQDPRETDNTSYFDNISWEGLKLADGISTGIFDYTLPEFKIFPNPSQDVWHIKSRSQIVRSVILFDSFGKQVLSVKPNLDAIQIDASPFSTGLYFARVETNFGVKTVKLIKR